ncbi:PREDICTED: 28 kDa ribonucleoprotein, chloroplastic [Nelumbo nucifera]|nr:PREDICTED: 28 kDa ribonucleoprotein, chloroplastic [Nelumbo nucifera]
MAAARGSLASSFSLSTPSPFRSKIKQCSVTLHSSPSWLLFPCPTLSCFLASSSIFLPRAHETFISLLSSIAKPRISRALPVVQEQPLAESETTSAKEQNIVDGSPFRELKVRLKPCQLYVCNLPRSCDISELLEMFKPYGTVQSVEVSRNVDTGISRGCGYVKMSSMNEAKAAIAALDRSDVGGREMRVRFCAEMNSIYWRKKLDSVNSAPNGNVVLESLHKVYVGNLAWSVTPEDLRQHFSQFGTVVSARVLYDRKGGKNRVYGFISFSSATECEAAISLSGAEFRGRKLLVRDVLKKSES